MDMLQCSYKFHGSQDQPPSWASGFQLDNHFGILDITIPDGEITPNKWDILFSIDISGSMADMCSDGKRKIDHVKNTLCNVLTIFSEHENDNVEFHVQVVAFDCSLIVVFPFTLVTSQNVGDLIQKIKDIKVNGSTNLLLPIMNANKLQTKCMDNHGGSHKFVHFMLTDGMDTCENEEETLVNHINIHYKSVFIGIGIDHDHQLLNTLANTCNGDYRFIDVITNAGLVYGELTHDLLYIVMDNITLDIEHGEIYDWTVDKWVTTININILKRGITKNYHIRCENPTLIRGILNGNSHIHNGQVCVNISTDTGVLEEDLTKYIYRQRVQEILYRTRKCVEYTNIDPYDRIRFIKPNAQPTKSPPKYNKTETRATLDEFYLKLYEYCTDHNCVDDPFWKTLLDDIRVAQKSMTMKNRETSTMYISSRERSQGNQHTFTVSNLTSNESDDHIFDLSPSSGNAPPPLTPYRSNHNITYGGGVSHQRFMSMGPDNDDDDDNATHVYNFVSQIQPDDNINSNNIILSAETSAYSSPYANPRIVRLMQQSSRPDHF